MSRSIEEDPQLFCNAPNLLGRLRGVKKKAGGLGLLVILLAGLGACASQPTFRPQILAGLGPVVQEIPGLRRAVESEAWADQPRSRVFLYFSRPAPEVQNVRLVAILRDLPDAPPLELAPPLRVDRLSGKEALPWPFPFARARSMW